MTQITTRPATKDDINTFVEKYGADMKAPTARAWVAELDGEMLAVGGIAYAGGFCLGFFELNERARELLKKNMYVRAYWFKIAMTFLRQFREEGVRWIYTDADMTYPKADELLERLGFRFYKKKDGNNIYRWSSAWPR